MPVTRIFNISASCAIQSNLYFFFGILFFLSLCQNNLYQCVIVSNVWGKIDLDLYLYFHINILIIISNYQNLEQQYYLRCLLLFLPRICTLFPRRLHLLLTEILLKPNSVIYLLYKCRFVYTPSL